MRRPGRLVRMGEERLSLLTNCCDSLTFLEDIETILFLNNPIVIVNFQTVAYLGGGHGAMSTPFWRQLIFSACNNLCGENNGLVACESSSKES